MYLVGEWCVHVKNMIPNHPLLLGLFGKVYILIVLSSILNTLILRDACGTTPYSLDLLWHGTLTRFGLSCWVHQQWSRDQDFGWENKLYLINCVCLDAGYGMFLWLNSTLIVADLRMQLGGCNMIVEVDEGQLGTKRKGGKGRDVSDTQQLILVMIERGTSVYIPIMIPNRQAVTLEPIMRRYLNMLYGNICHSWCICSLEAYATAGAHLHFL